MPGAPGTPGVPGIPGPPGPSPDVMKIIFFVNNYYFRKFLNNKILKCILALEFLRTIGYVSIRR